MQRVQKARLSDCFEIWEQADTHFKSFHTVEHFNSSQRICPFTAAAIAPTPSRFSLQISEHDHILLQPQHLAYINHSCEPNVYFDTASMHVIALREIHPREEITFFYPSTEWSMAEGFRCLCKSSTCLRYISGAACLPVNVLGAYRLSEHIQRLLLRRLANEVALEACHPHNTLLQAHCKNAHKPGSAKGNFSITGQRAIPTDL